MLSRGTFPAFILSMALVVLADPNPTTAPGQVFKEGSTCEIDWTPDPTGLWKTMNIQLMTGDNFHMVPLTTVATVDGTTSPGTFSYPCPAVTPHAPIYFYQFSYSGNATDLLWTGRFAIADSTGATVPAPNPTQPDGQAIPWGTGALADPSKAVPPPSYLPGGSGNTTTNSTSATGSAPSLAPSSLSKSTTNTPLAAAATSIVSTASSSGSPPAASTGSTAASNGNSNGALMLGAVSARAAHAGVALAVIAGAFTFMV